MRNCQQCQAECAEDHRFCPACGFPIAAMRPASGDPLIGRTLGGAYTILEHIGAGGMGRVYRAEQAVLGKTLAVKVIHPHLAGDESAAARFYAEARACSRLNHPNSVSVLDFGRTDDDRLFLVMEYLRGRDLARVVWEAGTLPVARAVGILRQVLGALGEAHEMGIIHRDIKPENILVEPLRTGGDFVKVVDFGLAKIRGDVAPGVTSPGLVCGTPDYMAPEQCRGVSTDPRSDLYSAAVVLYHCVTGRLPFEADVPAHVLLMHVNDPPPDPRQFVPDLPRAFVETLLKGLAKEPGDRFPTAVEFAEALERVVGPARTAPPPPRGLASDPPALEYLPFAAPPTLCPHCNATVPAGLKFCGECGARLPLASPRPPTSDAPGTQDEVAEAAGRAGRRSAPRTVVASSIAVLPFVGRDAELSQIELARARAGEGTLVALRVVGEEGSGRRRLVETAMESAGRAGAVVVAVGPDVAWAGVAYEPVGQAIRALLAIPAASEPGPWLAERARESGVELDPAVEVGFAEVFEPEGARDLDVRARTEGAVRALLYAMREAPRGKGRSVVLVFDQLHRMDAATLRVLAGLLARPVQVPAFVLMTHSPRLAVAWARCEAVTLRGLAPDQARQVAAAVRPTGPDEPALNLPSGEVNPLHLEQLVRWAMEGGGTPPARLVDLISARLERLPAQARRAVHVLAILGEETQEVVAGIAGGEIDEALGVLIERGWLRVDGAGPKARLRVAHPLLRELADASIPAAMRRELHQECVTALKDRALPLEVRALHAPYTEEPFQTLLLLEKVGDLALARGDDTAAAQALRRGLELARRELGHGEMDEPERAITIFTRKLGESLIRSGGAAEAEGVLREGLGLAPKTNPEWARLEGALGRALCARGRSAEGLRALESAISAARKMGARSVAAELLGARAEMETLSKAYVEAVQALEAADALLREALRGAPPNDPMRRQRVELLLRLARARRLAGRDPELVLAEARALADELGLVVVRAQCDAEVAERAEAMGDRRTALAAWRRAVAGSRVAGDAALEATYDERVRRLGRGEG